MTTSNAINANSSGIVIYDGAGNFSADTTTTHNVLVGAASNGIANVAPGASGTVLASNGVSADPSFQSIPGVGVTVTNHATLVGGASNSITSVGPGTSGHVLTSNGAGADPSFQALPAATGVQTLTDGSANVVSPTGGTITFTNGNNISNLSGSPSTITFSVSGTTNHAVQVGNSSGSLTSIGLGTAGQALVSGGAASNPSFQVLPVSGGGSGANSLTGVISGNGTSAFTASPVSQYASIVGGASNALSSVGPGAVGTVLAGNGASANPSFQTIPGLGTTVTQNAALVGGASNNIVSVGPGSTGQVLAGNTGSSPSFQNIPGVGVTVTEYATLVGGASNSIASLALGTAGQVLTSNGAGANPSFQSLPSSTGFTQINTQVFTSSGTYTPTAGMKYCIVECVGGGGGGGGANGNNNGCAAGGGGGAGGYCRKFLSAASVGVSQVVTIGSAGSGGVSNTNGTAGGNTTFGSILTANGGSGGSGATASSGNGGTARAGGAGGTATGGDVNSRGNAGSSGWGLLFVTTVQGEVVMGGAGAPSVFGGSAVSVFAVSGPNNFNGNAGLTYGAGGGGGITEKTTSTANGGAGFAGICIVTEFI